MYRLLITAPLVFALFGCEMAGEAKNVTTGGAAAFSCDQIRAAFSAYDADRSSFEALAELSGMTGFDITQVASQTADTYYSKARNSANLALIVKGCDPLQSSATEADNE
jgi:formylmethanofuran:tetrahydromethanopterin formyltransferase